MSKAILVTGATGKQGGATIDALLALPTASDFTILAVTRNPSSASAQALLSKSSSIKLVQGDLNDAPALFKTATALNPTIHGVFSVQIPMGAGQTTITEETQGKALVDAALLAAQVSHFVYTSVERGADSYNNPTPIPHFISKHNIEHHLVDSCANNTSMSYTILRPVAFMENWAPGFMGKMFGAMWASALGTDRKLQLVSVRDIGYFAAQAFAKPDEYRDRAIGLAGDEVTLEQADAVFVEKTGAPAPATYAFLGAGLLWGVKEVGTMFQWFMDVGYSVDIPALKKEHPGLLSLGEWIEGHSAHVKK